MNQSLPTAILGRTELKVTRLGYGAGHRRTMDDKQMEIQLNAVLDTANDYGNSEERIGRYVAPRRAKFIPATKCSCQPHGPHVWTRKNLFRGLHKSL